ncbi:MAG: SAM-dependent methyltransferase [Myxococcales bacterium]|nr:SAM-dependent methyltransferase [Myxococcales bacterium]
MSALARNQEVFGAFWRHFDLFPPERWWSWAEIAPFASVAGARRLDIGPGKFPRLPVAGTCFVDTSMAALAALQAAGGLCVRATSPLPFSDGAFDIVSLFEVLEHVDDDGALLREIHRVLRPGGQLFLSCPMNPAYWTFYDQVIGHVRRYRAGELEQKLARHGFTIERVCARDDRMDRWFGALFGFGVRHLPGLTARIVKRYLPKVAAFVWQWHDGGDMAEAERRGGVACRARRKEGSVASRSEDQEVADAVRTAGARGGEGLSLYESSYVDLVLCGESAGGPVALVAGSHLRDFPYPGTEPWDSCLLLVGEEGFVYTSRTPGDALRLDLDVEADASAGTIRFAGAMRRATSGERVEIALSLPVSLVKFPTRLLGERYNFLELAGIPGMRWSPYDLSGEGGALQVGGGAPVAVSGIRGSCERGQLTNLRAREFAIKYDYVAVARPGASGYGVIAFASHALHPEGAIGRAIDWYLRQSASARLIVSDGELCDGNPRDVYLPPQDDEAVLLFEERIDLGAALLQRQMIRTRDGDGATLHGLREIFTATPG